MVRVSEYYAESKPGLNYASSIRQVLRSVPPKYLRGLDCIILRDEPSLTTDERRKGLLRCQGVYVRGKGRRPPRVELFIDNILDEWPRWARYVPILRYEMVHRILFHELGHHVQDVLYHRTSQPEAGAWSLANELSRHSFKKRHPLLVPFVKVAYRAVIALQRLRKLGMIEG